MNMLNYYCVQYCQHQPISHLPLVPGTHAHTQPGRADTHSSTWAAAIFSAELAFHMGCVPVQSVQRLHLLSTSTTLWQRPADLWRGACTGGHALPRIRMSVTVLCRRTFFPWQPKPSTVLPQETDRRLGTMHCCSTLCREKVSWMLMSHLDMGIYYWWWAGLCSVSIIFLSVWICTVL